MESKERLKDTEKSSKKRGRITRIKEYEANCGMCPEETIESTSQTTKTEAAQELRRWGWIYTREHGWICPDCNEGRNENNAD